MKEDYGSLRCKTGTGTEVLLLDSQTMLVGQPLKPMTKPADVYVWHWKFNHKVALFMVLDRLGIAMGSKEEREFIAFLIRNTLQYEKAVNDDGDEKRRLLSCAIAIDLYFHERIQPDEALLWNWVKIQLEPA